MNEEPYPCNLPPWRRDFRAISPDGKWRAEIKNAREMYMAGPTKGILEIKMSFQIHDCSPAFVWSDDSRYLAVPQWKYWLRPRERLLIVDLQEQAVFASPSRYRLLILNGFEKGRLWATESPLWRPKELEICVEDVMQEYKRIGDRKRGQTTFSRKRGSGLAF